MSSLVAFLVAVAYVFLGYALGYYMANRGKARANVETAPDAVSDEFSITADEATQFLQRIHQVTSDVDHDVGRHASRVAEISGGLSSHDSTGQEGIVAAAAELMEANRQLQQDLASAREQIQVQREQIDSYMKAALTDELTGLANRRKFDDELNRRFAQWRRGGTALSLALVDVDNFKQFNDVHGHQVGDAVLQEVGAVLSESVRIADLVARYGGEEFGLILPGTTLPDARIIAERVRGAIEAHTFSCSGRELHMTVSAGVSEAMLINDPQVLISRADSAMYAAKQAGRNCCYAYDGDDCTPIEKIEHPAPRKSDRRQRVAPFVDGSFPEPGMFRDVECDELNAFGFSYVVEQKPDYDKVLLALGGGERAYTTATVQECLNVGTDRSPMYRVACRFTVPVDRFAEAAAG